MSAAPLDDAALLEPPRLGEQYKGQSVRAELVFQWMAYADALKARAQRIRSECVPQGEPVVLRVTEDAAETLRDFIGQEASEIEFLIGEIGDDDGDDVKRGLLCRLSEYPDEGALLLCETKAMLSAAPQPAVPQKSELVPVRKEVVDFLTGSAALDGVWFGGELPEGKPRYWWRSYLRSAAPQPTAAIARCVVTGNPCGSDPLPDGASCPSSDRVCKRRTSGPQPAAPKGEPEDLNLETLPPEAHEAINAYAAYYAEHHKLGMSIRKDMQYIALVALRFAHPLQSAAAQPTDSGVGG